MLDVNPYLPTFRVDTTPGNASHNGSSGASSSYRSLQCSKIDQGGGGGGGGGGLQMQSHEKHLPCQSIIGLVHM